jgi:cellulose synthase operon protein C
MDMFALAMTLKWGRRLTLCCGLLYLAGCVEKTPQQHLAAAQASLASNQPSVALVSAKAALQARPEWAEARYMLGKVLLEMGDASGAEAELRKARELRHAPDDVAPALARAMLLQRRFKEVAAELGSVQLVSPTAIAELKTSLASSHFALGDTAAMAQALALAKSAVPEHLPAALLEARALASEGRFDAALPLLDKVLERSPEQHEAWTMKGEFLLAGANDSKGATAAFKRALAARPDFVQTHMRLVQLHLSQRDVDAAATQLAAMSQLHPNHVQTKLLQAQLAFARGDMPAARAVTQQLLGRVPADPGLLMLAGTIELRASKLSDAEAHLRKALQLVPEAGQVRLRLAQTYLRAGQAAKASETLAPLLASAKPDPELLATHGEVLLLTGDAKKAEAVFRQVAKLNPADIKSRTSLALAQLSSGRLESGMADLQRVAAEDTGPMAELALVSVHMSKRNYGAALKAIDALSGKLPKSPMPAHLRGVVELALQKPDAASKSFEAALALDPTYLASLQNLAALDLADKKPQRAIERYQALLAVQPGNPQALLALATLRARAGGQSDEVATLLAQAVKSSPAEVAPRLRLIELHLATKDIAAALAVAQAGVQAVPQNAELWDMLGRVQSQQGDLNQALASCNKLKALLPASAVPLLRLADVLVASNKRDAAMQHLEQALKLKPDLLVAQRNLLALQIGSGKLADAAKLVKEVRRQRPREAAGFVFEGDLAMSRKELPAALAAYQKAMALQASTPLAIKLHLALAQGGKAAEADALSERWLKAHGSDTEFLVHLGRLAMARQSFDVAKQRFEQVLQQQPDHVVALNHLAQTLTQMKLPAAVAHASKANDLAPGQPGLMVTYAAALAMDNQLPQAAVLQRKALELQPAHHALRLDLARLYLRAGDRAQARTELLTLSALGAGFAQRREVEALLASLR